MTDAATDGAATDGGPVLDTTEALFTEASVLADLQAELEHVDEVPIDRRPALLERANAALVDALNDLEEV